MPGNTERKRDFTLALLRAPRFKGPCARVTRLLRYTRTRIFDVRTLLRLHRHGSEKTHRRHRRRNPRRRSRARTLTPDTVREIRAGVARALRDFFSRAGRSTTRSSSRLRRALGVPVEYPFIKGLPGFPCITPVVKLEHERHNFGGIWHSDTTYLETPPMGTLLLAREVPPAGGDTLFANQYLAYETLSDGLKQTLADLIGVASSAKADVTRDARRPREDRWARRRAQRIQRRAPGRAHASRNRPQGALRECRPYRCASKAGPKRKARRC